MIRSLAAVAIPLFGELNARTNWRDFLLHYYFCKEISIENDWKNNAAVMEKEIFSYYLDRYKLIHEKIIILIFLLRFSSNLFNNAKSAKAPKQLLLTKDFIII